MVEKVIDCPKNDIAKLQLTALIIILIYYLKLIFNMIHVMFHSEKEKVVKFLKYINYLSSP